MADVDRSKEQLIEEIAVLRGQLAALKDAQRRSASTDQFQIHLVNAIGHAVIYTDLGGKIIAWNRAAEVLYGWPAAEVLGRNIQEVTPATTSREQATEIMARLQSGESWSGQLSLSRRDGSTFRAMVVDTPVRDDDGELVGIIGISSDLTEQQAIEAQLREETETVETVNRIGQMLSAELDVQKLVQAVTDAATDLTGAEFGAFFYNALDDRGEYYTLYTISGVPREAFSRFPLPRNTNLFGPTFRGEGIIRLADVRLDPRHGNNSPYFGMPPGHLTVVSYLAVPVISRSGEVIGGLFFGHSRPGVFSEREERIVVGLAAQAAIAMDNARLFESVQRERAEAEVSEQRYRFLAETIPQIVWTARPDGWLDYANQRWFEYTGLTLEQTKGEGWQTVLHPDDVLPAAERWNRSLRMGETYEIESRFRRSADGAYRWHLIRALPMRDYCGGIVKWFGTSTDIDDQRRATDITRFLAEASTALSSSLDDQATLDSVVQLAVPTIADWCSVDLVDADGSFQTSVIAHADPRKVDLLRQLRRRYPPDVDAPHGIGHVMRTREPELVPEISEALLARVARDEEHLALLRGLEITSMIVVPLLGRGRNQGALSLGLAESGRRYTQADLTVAEELARRVALAIDNVRLYREAREAIRVRDQFLSIASHELKTPLTSLMGYAELIQRRAEREGSLSERDRRAVAVIVDQSERLNRLIGSLLDLSRIETGQLSIERLPIDLDTMARRLVEEVQPSLDHHLLRFSGAPEPQIVEGDELRLEQVVQNLIQNAVKYSPEGGTIDLQVQRCGDAACVSVTDQGIGIPPEALPRLFQRFYRAPNVNPQHISGLGVGLYVVKEIVTLHGGTIGVASREGAGSTFTIRLPLAKRRYP
jgi:PAS domain S-box-containing protein